MQIDNPEGTSPSEWKETVKKPGRRTYQALRIDVNSFFVPRRLKIRTAAIKERSRITP